MELKITATPEELKKVLQAISASEEHEGKIIAIKSTGTLFIPDN
ncbi:hypothetical protein [Leuconostoc citreum]|nr:hypothetical protein [Leuconostoc citreum]